jgi:alpha-beta hydrolase superfamily lysophospholipase
MKFKQVRFYNAAGLQLSGRIDLPLEENFHTLVVFAHCFTCGKNANSAAYISRFMTQKGFGIFRFDFTGLGESQGDFSDTNFATNVQDLIYAAKFLTENYQSPKVLIGHSLGGSAVIQAATQLDSVKAVVTIGSPADPKHVLTHLSTSAPVIETKGEAMVDLGGRPFKIKRQFIEDLKQNRMDNALRNLNKALLVMHSPLDNIVGIDHAAMLFQKARHPKSFISLDGADHLLVRKTDAEYAAAVITAWLARYL